MVAAVDSTFGERLRPGHDGPSARRSGRFGRDEGHIDPLDELAGLAETAGAKIVGRFLQNREKPHPRTFIGPGKMEEIAESVRGERADVVVFDHDLSPAQLRNLENGLGVKVLDRTELILDIFAINARTGQAKLQVELAQLEYNLPRLKRMWTHLGQQAGGTAGGLGGIGTRGPGEKQIEVDRRIARKRIRDLRREIRKVESRKQREVGSRAGGNYTVSLVGYTNAGKSTIMNRLTGAGVRVDDRLFSTLDTRTRVWQLQTGMKVFLSDTVGFIRNLPHDLVASFHATLEELTQADLLLHVVDVAHPDSEAQIRSVREVLRQLRCHEKESLLIFNKADLLRDTVERDILRSRHPEAILVSAGTGDGLDELTRQVSRVVTERLEELDLEVPLSEGRLLAELGGSCIILRREYLNEHVRMRVRAPKRQIWKLAPYRAEEI